LIKSFELILYKFVTIKPDMAATTQEKFITN